ncbi:MAG: cell division topological specificity factor MinE [Candidatus Eremiobacteraeota bacterium]|nr:cell division topological specificity factor MinE [Candidatus Eremiobacteraeota bacterium]
MFDFFNKLFNPTPPSGATAKERLRLVLLSDHLSLAPEVVEDLKRDLLVVISRYVEIDRANADVTFEHRQGEVAMLASIPITGVRERIREEPPAPPAPPVAQSAPKEAEHVPQLAAVSDRTAHDAAPAQTSAAEESATVKAAAPRRRRRRKAGAAKRAAQPGVQLSKPAQA